MHIHPNLLEIASPFEAFLIDAYGVFWGGNAYGVLPGSKETMQALVAQGKIIGVLSNSTQLAAKEIEKLHHHGLIEGQHFHFLITSGEICRQAFLQNTLPFATLHKKYILSGPPHPKFSSQQAIFEGSPFTATTDVHQADFIYTSIPHIEGKDQTDLEIFRAPIKQLAQSKLIMVCANPDRYAHEGMPPQAVIRQGSIAAMYEEEGGKVFYIGKPHAAVYQAAMQNFGHWNIVNPAKILMVGDTPETDIRGARSFGMHSALVSGTGIMAERIAKQGLEQAMTSVSPKEIPDYIIERL